MFYNLLLIHMPNGMENYMEDHIMGSVSQISMKPSCDPSKYTKSAFDTNRTIISQATVVQVRLLGQLWKNWRKKKPKLRNWLKILSRLCYMKHCFYFIVSHLLYIIRHVFVSLFYRTTGLDFLVTTIYFWPVPIFKVLFVIRGFFVTIAGVLFLFTQP